METCKELEDLVEMETFNRLENYKSKAIELLEDARRKIKEAEHIYRFDLEASRKLPVFSEISHALKICIVAIVKDTTEIESKKNEISVESLETLVMRVLAEELISKREEWQNAVNSGREVEYLANATVMEEPTGIEIVELLLSAKKDIENVIPIVNDHLVEDHYLKHVSAMKSISEYLKLQMSRLETIPDLIVQTYGRDGNDSDYGDDFGAVEGEDLYAYKQRKRWRR